MNRTTTTLVFALSVLLLGGAWWASKALTAEVPLPPSAGVVANPPVQVPVQEPVTPPVTPVMTAEVTPPNPETMAPRIIQMTPLVTPPPRPLVPPPPRAPPPEPPRLPREGMSEGDAERAAIGDGAWDLLKDPNGGTATWQRAAGAFQRCLSMAPDDARCKAGLAAARDLMGPRPFIAPGQRRLPRDED